MRLGSSLLARQDSAEPTPAADPAFGGQTPEGVAFGADCTFRGPAVASTDATIPGQAFDASDFARCSLALSEGEMRMTAHVIAAERARIAVM